MTPSKKINSEFLMPGNILKGEGDFSKDLILGSGDCHIALCTLWTPREMYRPQLVYVGVIGNLYFSLGIGILIRDILATPEIRYLVITGKDCPEPSQQVANPLLTGNFDPLAEPQLKPELVEEFYRRVKLVDGRHIGVREQEELSRLIMGIAQPIQQNALEPIFEPLEVPISERFPTSRSGHLIRANSIQEAHVRLLQEIRRFGEITQPDDRGRKRQELWQLTVCLSDGSDFRNVPHYSHAEVTRYGEAMWNGDEPQDVTYRYGHTIRYKYGDQLQAVIQAFKKKPETYRTVVSLWEPLASLERDDEPCLITIHPRIRNGILDLFAYIRTNEMYRGWPENAAGLRYWQDRLAQELNVELGELTISSGSAHIYDYEFGAVDNYLQQFRLTEQEKDPKGDWLFEQDGSLFVAKHIYRGQIIQILKAKSQRELEKSVAPFISDVPHAIYIGRQIAQLKQR